MFSKKRLNLGNIMLDEYKKSCRNSHV